MSKPRKKDQSQDNFPESQRIPENSGLIERYELKWLAPVVAVSLLVFANTIGGEFVYDDLRQILRNPLIQENALIWKALTSDVWAFKGDGSIAASNYWRPTFTLWHIINFRLFGANPIGWHILNILLHGGVSSLVFFLLRRWGLPAMASCGMALIFAAHPVHVESVAWISGSPDLLFSVAFLGSLWFAQNFAAGRKIQNLALSLLLYAIALGAKEIGILCLPIYYFAMYSDESEAGNAKPDFLHLGGYFAIAAIYFFLRFSILGAISRPPEDAVSLGEALLSIPSIFAFYLRQAFFPLWLSPNYPLQPVSSPGLLNFILPGTISLLFLVCLGSLAKASKRRMMATLIFLLPLIPAMNATAFIPDQIVHDRYLYLPLFGLLALAGFFALQFIDGKKILIASGAVAAVFAIQTFSYNHAWANEFDLWAWSAKVDNSAFTLSQYGNELSNKGRHDEAIIAYSASLEKRPMLRSYYGRAKNYHAKRSYAEAEKDILVVTTAPREKQEAYLLYQAYELLAIIYIDQKRFDDAAQNLAAARKELPIYSASLTVKLAVVLYQKGDKEMALKELESAKEQARKELLPEAKAVFLRLGMLYAEQGRKEESRAALQEYLRLTDAFRDQNTQRERQQAAIALKAIG